MKNQLKSLIHRVGETVVKVKSISLELLQSLDPGVQGIGAELCRLLPIMERIVDVARRNRQGETVPVTEKAKSHRLIELVRGAYGVDQAGPS